MNHKVVFTHMYYNYLVMMCEIQVLLDVMDFVSLEVYDWYMNETT